MDRRPLKVLSAVAIAASIAEALTILVSGGGVGLVLSCAGGLVIAAMSLALSTWGGTWGSGYAPFALVTPESERQRRAVRRTQVAMAVAGLCWVAVVVLVVDGPAWLTMVLAAFGAVVVGLAGVILLRRLGGWGSQP